MAQPQRLPVVNSDDGIWGDVLNQYVGTEHFTIDSNTTQGTSRNGSHAWINILAADSTAAGNSGTASGAPMKFHTAPLLGTAQAGAVEFLTDRLYFTNTSGPARKAIATYADGVGGNGGATGDIYFRDASGNFTALPIGSLTNVLTVSGTPAVPVWAAQVVPGLSQQQVMAISSMRM
jgi:hypothetical protein